MADTAGGVGQGQKQTTFEWCLDWPQLARFFEQAHLGVQNDREAAVLVAGSGTSKLSWHLFADAGFGQITSVDSDPGCVEHMRQIYPELTWVIADLTTPACRDAGVVPHGYDLVVDKSTLDCIQCEIGTEAVAGYFIEVRRSLSDGGIFMLISFQDVALLNSLLVSAGFVVRACDQVLIASQPTMPKISVLVLRKAPGGAAPAVGELAVRLKECMDAWHIAHPLLTPQERLRISSNWVEEVSKVLGRPEPCQPGLGAGLPLAKAHEVLFDRRLRQEFPLPDFLDALQLDRVLPTPAPGSPRLTLEQGLDFIVRNQ